MMHPRKYVPYAWIAIVAVFLIRAPHPAASGSVDPDVYWHLLYGHWILDHLAIPTGDMWSWTVPGKAYSLTQWLGEVAIAGAERIAGETGKQTLAATLASLTILLSYKAARCYLTNRTAAIMSALVGCTVMVSMTCRPHLFTFAGLAALSWIFAAQETSGRKWPLFLVPPIMALWVNLHGGYAFGLIYLWLHAGAAAVAAFTRNEMGKQHRTILLLCAVALAGTVATAINPYGFNVWANTAAVGALKSVSAGLTEEWIPTNIRTNLGFAYLTVVLATIMSVAFSDKRPDMKDGLMLMALLVIGWWATRMSIMASILLVPIIAKFFGHTAFYRLAFADKAKSEGRLHPLASLLIVAIIGTTGYLVGRSDKTIEKRIERDFPVEEVAFLKQHNFHGTIMNPMEAGGYLIRYLGQPVFLDTRLDLYGDDYFFAFMQATAGADNWEAFMAKWSPDLVMLEHGMPLKTLLIQAGTYKVVFSGPRYTMLLKANLTL